MAPKSKAGAAPRPGKAVAAPEQQRTPDWPVFQPLVPSYQLELHEVVRNQIVTIPYFWTSKLCERYVSFLSTLPLLTTPGKPKKGDAVRVNDRFQIQDRAFAERLWSETALREVVLNADLAEEGAPSWTDEDRRRLWGGDVVRLHRSSSLFLLCLRRGYTKVGLNPNIRIYRYKKGQFFDQHCKLVHLILSHYAEKFFCFVHTFESFLRLDIAPNVQTERS